MPLPGKYFDINSQSKNNEEEEGEIAL